VSALATYERKFREVDDRLLHLKGLILVRALLEERGASEAELREHGDEITRVRTQLAQLIERSGGLLSTQLAS
jgi:hypothetical protein